LSPEQVVADDRAFERLYSSYAPNVFRYALTVLGQKADAEDVTQTTFMNAYRAFQRGERPQKPEQWLITIAHNACLQRFRHDQRRPREVALHGELAVAAVEEDGAPTAQELRRAIEQLPPTQRSALVMRELEGRSYADMAATLRISVSALETLLFRARRTLREQLGEQLSCHDASAAIARQLEGQLPNDERRALRAHLRSCEACATYARSMRAQRQPLRGLVNLPLPSWVGRFIPAVSRVMGGASSSGGIGAAGIAVKAAAIVVAGSVVGGGVYESATHIGPLRSHSAATNVSGGTSGALAVGAGPNGAIPSSPAALQPGGAAQGLPVSSGPANVPADSPAPASGVTTAAPPAGSDNVRQPTAVTSGAQGDAAGPATSPTSTQSDLQASTAPPGQAKKNANGNSASANAQGASNGTKVPPGQAKKDTTSNANANAALANGQGASNGTKAPPGQANTNAAAGDSGASSAPSASEASAAPAAGVSTPPAANVPPGQAKKDANATAPADPAPSDPATSSTAQVSASVCVC
jgi:RNA polymerase sigma factor (sigma-70 family)